MAYSAYLPAYSALPGMTNAQYRQQQLQEQELAAQYRAQQNQQVQYAQQPGQYDQYGQPIALAYGTPEYAAQQRYGLASAQYRQQYGVPAGQYAYAQPNQAIYAAQPYGAARALSNSNLVTAVGYSRPLGNGTAGNLEEHRNAIQSVHYLDRGYNQY